MRPDTPVEIIGITMHRDKYLMYFTQMVDVFPLLKGSTAISQMNKMLTGKKIVPAAASPITIRSFN